MVYSRHVTAHVTSEAFNPSFAYVLPFVCAVLTFFFSACAPYCSFSPHRSVIYPEVENACEQDVRKKYEHDRRWKNFSAL